MELENLPRVAIVILNWNNAEDTLRCLSSVCQLDYPNYSVVLVDNGSTDDSVQRIRQTDPELTLIETGSNLGYAGGNNIGIQYALDHGARFICILNNDVVVDPRFLMPLLSVLQSSYTIGVATPLIAEMAEEDRVWTIGAAIDYRDGIVSRLFAGEEVTSIHRKEPFDVDVAPGSVLLVKSDVFRNSGLLAEEFYLYYEEADWSLRVTRSGYKIVAVPQSLVWHRVSASIGINSPIVDYYMQRNQFLFVERHWRGSAEWVLLVRLLLRNVLTISAYTVKSNGGSRLAHRNARLYALRDALLRRWGKIGEDVLSICRLE